MGEFSADTRLLVIAPHPDDETISSGHLIQQVQAAGGQVQLILLTDGDNNPWPQRWLERRWRIDLVARQRWGRRRRVEAIHAWRLLGLGPEVVHDFGWLDGGVTRRLFDAFGSSVCALQRVLEAFQPNILVLPALGDRHPDHGSAHVLVRLAWHGWRGHASGLAYLLHGPSAPAVSTIGWPMSPIWQANKLAALECYATQLVLSGGRMRRLAARRERFLPLNTPPPNPRGVLPWRPADYLRPWLRLMTVGASGARDLAWNDADPVRREDGRWQISASNAESPDFARLYLARSSPWIFDHWGWCEI